MGAAPAYFPAYGGLPEGALGGMDGAGYAAAGAYRLPLGVGLPPESLKYEPRLE